MKFIKRHGTRQKIRGEHNWETSFTNEGNLQAPELFLCRGAVHRCDDDVLDITCALVLLSPGDRDLQPLC